MYLFCLSSSTNDYMKIIDNKYLNERGEIYNMKKITFLLFVLLLFTTACNGIDENISETPEDKINRNIFDGELPDFDGYEFLLKTI